MCVTHGPWFPSLHAIFSKVETDEIVQCLQIQDAFRVSTASGVGNPFAGLHGRCLRRPYEFVSRGRLVGWTLETFLVA
jgi:hypothetical protein